MSAPSYLERLARSAAAVRLDAVPASTVAAAKLVLLDTLGAIAAGSAQPENAALAKLAARRPGGSTLIGHGAKCDAFWAALANASAGVAREVDEGSRLGGGHPSIHTPRDGPRHHHATSARRPASSRQAGKDMLDGFKMGFEQAGWQAAGRKIELFEEDTEGNPATAQAKYRKLAQHLPDGLAVLDLRAGGIPQVAGVRPELRAGEAVSAGSRA